jgi:hypothetical protein
MGDTDPLLTHAAIVDTVKSKWWIVPLVVAVATALLFAQESNLDVEPSSATVSRTYEARETYSALASLGIDPQAFAPLLSVSGQIALFNSETERERRNEEHGFEAHLTLTQMPGDYTVVNQEVADRRTIYSVLVTASSFYSMSCENAEIAVCQSALDVGKQEFESARISAIGDSITNVTDALQLRLDSVRESIAKTSDPTALVTQRQLEIELSSQIDALTASIDNDLYALEPIDETVTEPAPTVTSVSTSTYLLGALIGVFVAVLILLQFAVLRSRRR